MPTLVSIQVGLPRSMGEAGASDPLDRPWRSAIFKSPVAGPVALRAQGLDGDGQADRRHHGGLDMAALAYCAEHYPRWAAEPATGALGAGILEGSFGGFGENLTIAGLDESNVHVGDTFRIGRATAGALVQVSQPRRPCQNLARRWRLAELPALVEANDRSGWYFRVLEEGVLEAGMIVERVGGPGSEFTVAMASAIYRNRRRDPAAAARLAACPALSAGWREDLGG